MKDLQVYPVARNNDIVMLEAKDELLIYDLKNNNAYCLNKTAAFVWQNCNGKNSATDIKNKFNLKLDSKINEDFVNFTLTELFKKDLIKKESFPIGEFSTVSRREAVRKLGFGMMAAIPLISMIAVPAAGQGGGSCIGITDPCSTTSGPACCPGAGVCQVNRCCNLSTGICTQPIQCCSNDCNILAGTCNPPPVP